MSTASRWCSRAAVISGTSAPWIHNLRRTSPGALVLGYGFLWSDVACYTVGVALSVTVEYFFTTHRDLSTSSR